MQASMLIDQSALAAFVACPRRFQLRYLSQLPWPAVPLDRAQSLAVERGRQFHRLVERYFLGLPVEEEALADNVLRDWWQRFISAGPALPNGRRWPEFRLTIPVDDVFLVGRFDLLILGEENGRPAVYLYDWKTSRPRSRAELAADWQTRIYLALAAESQSALAGSDKPPAAEDISLTYWYTSEPESPRAINYSNTAHAQNWAEIRQLVRAIKAHRGEPIWPLTEDLRQCRYCAYQILCGREASDKAAGEALDADEALAANLSEVVALFEPQTP